MTPALPGPSETLDPQDWNELQRKVIACSMT